MSETDEEKTLNFHEMGLDDRILKAIANLGWETPTPIQEKAIPLALEGKDILARARTGSGKTAAFSIPVVQKILQSKQTSKEQCTKALFLTPSKELCNQAYKNLMELTSCCSREIKCVDVSPKVPLLTQRPKLMEKPDIVVGTPTRILAHIQAGNLSIKDTLEMLVIDEADLVFSFGYEDDVKAIIKQLPKIYQAFLMSATLSDDVLSLKKLVLHNAVILKLEESQLPESSQLTQYHIKCEEEDKFTLICALLKLGLVRGKSIIFVNNVNRCYKLKLFLEQFGIKSCVLNSELPVSSRCHIVTQYNEGLYDYIIASDETLLMNPKTNPNEPTKKKHKQIKRDKEYGVSRGIDFQNVSNVINFDFPSTVDTYIHRVGRTARGDNQGTALSFVNIKEMKSLEAVEEALAESTPDGENVFKPYNFKMAEIDGFKYRAKDAMRAVTKVAIREARLKEIKIEILTSQKLKSYFEDNPRDLQVLRHDKSLHTVKSSSHLKDVPDYLIPQTLKNLSGRGRQSRSGNRQFNRGPTQTEKKFRKRKADPLKSFEFAGLGNKKKRRK
ncbi:probable ATP-dependent RNA helicase DDX56 [Mytilus californianus]|uniref:probable ATP-dependent RNA helicase DDX56 n=1 Tax=Mytilus californianus TaxID=6549 RepID=UPI0022478842|nr:probable ATP-dependent RNA helicase DDX56 [Mytilus californianus]